jgi:DNA-binding PadR family transcriptional regulator
MYPVRCAISLLALGILYETPMHVNRLLDEIEERTGGFSTREPESTYMVLRLMEEEGLLASTWQRGNFGPLRRVYSVTENGADALKKGLRTIVKRKKLLDDMIELYERIFAE